ncbi:hypothetical protein ES702_05539 [subsurface metagenome]
MSEVPDLYMLTPVLTILVMVFLLILMIYFYSKTRVFPIILTIFSFSLIFGVYSLEIENIPFTPYFQIFFLTIQGMLFILTALNVYTDVSYTRKSKRGR